MEKTTLFKSNRSQGSKTGKIFNAKIYAGYQQYPRI